MRWTTRAEAHATKTEPQLGTLKNSTRQLTLTARLCGGGEAVRLGGSLTLPNAGWSRPLGGPFCAAVSQRRLHTARSILRSATNSQSERYGKLPTKVQENPTLRLLCHPSPWWFWKTNDATWNWQTVTSAGSRCFRDESRSTTSTWLRKTKTSGILRPCRHNPRCGACPWLWLLRGFPHIFACTPLIPGRLVIRCLECWWEYQPDRSVDLAPDPDSP